MPCAKAYAILGQAYEACESFHVIFKQLRKDAGRGTTTDAQQDTLRAMLVFACAGLDAAIKQLVRDALQGVINLNPGAEANFTESVKRKLPDVERSRDLLATVLTAPNPRQALLERVTSDLIADSLQSFEQLSKVAAAFNIKTSGIADVVQLKLAFRVRNEIIHEMDIDFQANRSRRQRRQADMEAYTRVILEATAYFLEQVDATLK
jgi:hypothetical protein